MPLIVEVPAEPARGVRLGVRNPALVLARRVALRGGLVRGDEALHRLIRFGRRGKCRDRQSHQGRHETDLPGSHRLLLNDCARISAISRGRLPRRPRHGGLGRPPRERWRRVLAHGDWIPRSTRTCRPGLICDRRTLLVRDVTSHGCNRTDPDIGLPMPEVVPHLAADAGLQSGDPFPG